MPEDSPEGPTDTSAVPFYAQAVPIYGIGDDGAMYQYAHEGFLSGSPSWANGGRRTRVPGVGWNEGRQIFKGQARSGPNVIYKVNSKGDLLWFRHVSNNAADGIVGPRVVGHGWDSSRKAFAAGDGVIYSLNADGNLYWFRHLGYGSGADQWANDGSGIRVGWGWDGARLAFAGGSGSIYSVHSNGDLLWQCHSGQTAGTGAWANNGQPKVVGSLWQDVTDVVSGGEGIIYAVKRDGNMYWYNHKGYAKGVPDWASGQGAEIGSGWQEFVRIF